MNCPDCHGKNIIKYGKIHNGKQRFECKDCDRQFVENPQNKNISEEIKKMIDKLLLEKLPLAGIVRVIGVSESWLQDYVNKKYEEIPKEVKVKEKSKYRLTIECDEMWSFVGNKGNKVWIWLAKDIDTKEIVGVYVGSRDRHGAKGL